MKTVRLTDQTYELLKNQKLVTGPGQFETFDELIQRLINTNELVTLLTKEDVPEDERASKVSE